MCGARLVEEMKDMNERAIEVLRAILAEAAGHDPAFSADSYLPPHLIHDARKVIEDHDAREVIKEHEQAIARRQHDDRALLLPVDVMVDAQQDAVHIDTGASRPAKAYRLEHGIRIAEDHYLGGL